MLININAFGSSPLVHFKLKNFQLATYCLLCLADLAALVLETIANNTVVSGEHGIVPLMTAVLREIQSGNHEARVVVALG